MLEFEPLTINSLKRVLPYIQRNNSVCSDISTGYFFMWNDNANIQFCISDDTFVVSQIIGEQIAFCYPIGANPETMIEKLKEYSSYHNLPLRFFAIDDQRLEMIKNNDKLENIMFAYDRRWSDYVYSFEEILDFKGKKFSGQRNHINKFKKLYGEPSIRLLTKNDQDIVYKMLDEYEKEHLDSDKLEKIELAKTYELFDAFTDLGLISGGLFIDEKLVAFCICEVINETLLIHVEKGLKQYDGVYPTMFSGFSHLIKDLGCKIKYINREDDSGDIGLRTSKTQYHPIFIANKYLVHVNSPAYKMEPVYLLNYQDIVLTEIKENDKAEYLRLNIDLDNNKYWGYDYREDINISGKVDENTFYDSLKYDIKAGDSINFAIRLSKNGKMIGEVILWNFTINQTAEIGCRVLPEYQNKGYGTMAFKKVVDYANNILGLKVFAKCYRQNISSAHMIVNCGFTKYGEDDEFYYFQENIL